MHARIVELQRLADDLLGVEMQRGLAAMRTLDLIGMVAKMVAIDIALGGDELPLACRAHALARETGLHGLDRDHPPVRHHAPWQARLTHPLSSCLVVVVVAAGKLHNVVAALARLARYLD